VPTSNTSINLDVRLENSLRIKQQKTDRRLTHIVPERLHVGVE
jgi:hypothetical protein